ncbi:MAG: quinoprotein relay system zinc metallohydrolase 2 [Burkholderiales bacterium]
MRTSFFVAALVGALLCARTAPLSAQAAMPLAVTEIASGVFVHSGLQEDVGPPNGGDIANIGFVVGERCVAVIDSGSTRRIGDALRVRIRQATDKPVCYVINTHVHPDHIFGNAAFQADAPQFVGHANLPSAMAAKGPTYLNALGRILGPAAEGSTLVPPTTTVAAERRIDLGGRVLSLKAWPTAHTDNDLTVFDEASQTLWTGDLVFVERIPSVDGSLRGWVRVLPEIARTAAIQVVPGHGPVQRDWPRAIEPLARYLERVLTETRQAIRDQRTIQSAVDTVAREEAARWPLADEFHRRNVTAAFAELEWED